MSKKSRGYCRTRFAAAALAGTLCAILAQPGYADASAAAAAASENQTSTAAPESKKELSEVVVTARKREELLQDVPASVTVVSADSMIQNNMVFLQDYYARVPGVQLEDVGGGTRLYFTMRGISTGSSNPTVGVTIDDVPVGQTVTADVNNSIYTPQLDPADLQRIEFLKGPQGTLYGASSLGGVMRYVTLAPSLTATSLRADVEGNTMSGGGSGYAVRANGNLPVITDTLAIRLSVFDRQDPGFVDDPAHGLSNVNQTDAYGGHVSVLWHPTEALSIRLASLIDKQQGADGTIDTNYAQQFIYGNSQNRLIGTGGFWEKWEVDSATVNYHTDYFDITSISGYNAFNVYQLLDSTPSFGAFAQSLFGVGGSAFSYPVSSYKYSQELRLTSSSNARLEWQAGAFYTSESVPFNHAQFTANNTTTGEAVGLLFDAYDPSRYREYAGFGDLIYHFTDQFNVQLGARESHNWQSFWEVLAGPAEGGVYQFDQKVSANAFTYLVTPQLKLSDTLQTYVRVASGYQPGGPNTPGGPGQNLPPTYQPAKTVNYEVGVKSELLDKRLTTNAAIFYIDWKNVQLQAFTPPPASFPFIFNGGKAKSEGLELEIDAKPTETLTLNATTAFTEAILTSTPGHGFPGVAGEPLPFSAKWTASLAAEQQFQISNSTTGFVGISGNYVSKRDDEEFAAGFSPPQPSVPGYATGDLRGGVVWDGYTITVYDKNFTNNRGLLTSTPFSGSYAPGPGIWQTTIVRPRTLGVSVSKDFF
jgi:iron complex outermembrane receptor protein